MKPKPKTDKQLEGEFWGLLVCICLGMVTMAIVLAKTYLGHLLIGDVIWGYVMCMVITMCGSAVLGGHIVEMQHRKEAKEDERERQLLRSNRKNK